MKVTLREKPISGNRKSLYLDFYPPILVDGKYTRRDFLRLYIHVKPKNEDEREHNKTTKILAGKICAQRQLELQENAHGFTTKKRNGDFLQYFKNYVANKRIKSESLHETWRSTGLYLEDFCDGHCNFGDINENFVEKFRDYLLTTLPYKIKISLERDKSRSKSQKKTLSPNSAKAYFERFLSVVKDAFRRNYLMSDPTVSVESIKKKTPKRDFFTWEELEALNNTQCGIPSDFRRVCLFSALSGLRHIDIMNLSWANVRGNEENGFFLDYEITKTGEQSVLPISLEARLLLGDAGEQNEKVFPGMKYNGNVNYHLEIWTKAAGIKRRVTFHAFRRSYATGQITRGVDIYTVRGMLGHQDVKTTQIYANLVDPLRRAAADKMKLK